MNITSINSANVAPNYQNNCSNLKFNKVGQSGYDSVSFGYNATKKGMNQATSKLKTLFNAILISSAMLLTSMTFNGCKKVEVDNTVHIYYVQGDPEETEFLQNACNRLLSDPELLQSCLEYCNSLGLINESCLTSSDKDYRVTIAMNCIMTNSDVREWFISQTTT